MGSRSGPIRKAADTYRAHRKGGDLFRTDCEYQQHDANSVVPQFVCDRLDNLATKVRWTLGPDSCSCSDSVGCINPSPRSHHLVQHRQIRWGLLPAHRDRDDTWRGPSLSTSSKQGSTTARTYVRVRNCHLPQFGPVLSERGKLAISRLT